MALIKEDGTIVANADTYAEHTDLTAYAALRGITISAVQADLEGYLVLAMDFLTRYREMWKGDRIGSTQELDWPRSGVYIDGQLVASTEIPRELFYAQLALAVAASEGELMPTSRPTDKGAVIKEKVDVIEVGYANPGSVLPVAADSTADALLRVLLKRSGLTVVRA